MKRSNDMRRKNQQFTLTATLPSGMCPILNDPHDRCQEIAPQHGRCGSNLSPLTIAPELPHSGQAVVRFGLVWVGQRNRSSRSRT